jgi:hypothetical protein
MILALTSVILWSSGCTIVVQQGKDVIVEKYIIMHSGIPIEVLENTEVQGKALNNSSGCSTWDIGGWIAMPPEHWNDLNEVIGKLKMKISSLKETLKAKDQEE